MCVSDTGTSENNMNRQPGKRYKKSTQFFYNCEIQTFTDDRTL